MQCTVPRANTRVILVHNILVVLVPVALLVLYAVRSRAQLFRIIMAYSSKPCAPGRRALLCADGGPKINIFSHVTLGRLRSDARAQLERAGLAEKVHDRTDEQDDDPGPRPLPPALILLVSFSHSPSSSGRQISSSNCQTRNAVGSTSAWLAALRSAGSADLVSRAFRLPALRVPPAEVAAELATAPVNCFTWRDSHVSYARLVCSLHRNAVQ